MAPMVGELARAKVIWSPEGEKLMLLSTSFNTSCGGPPSTGWRYSLDAFVNLIEQTGVDVVAVG